MMIREGGVVPVVVMVSFLLWKKGEKREEVRTVYLAAGASPPRFLLPSVRDASHQSSISSVTSGVPSVLWTVRFLPSGDASPKSTPRTSDQMRNRTGSSGRRSNCHVRQATHRPEPWSSNCSGHCFHSLEHKIGCWADSCATHRTCD